MNPASPTTDGALRALLQGDPAQPAATLHTWSRARLLRYAGYLVVGTGIFGAALGAWRSPLQALYTGIKFPLVILLTTGANAGLNGILAALLGLNLSFRQSFAVVLMSFTVAGAILGAFSPVLLFLVWNTPAPVGQLSSVLHGYELMQLAAVGFIAFAGVVANLRLRPLLVALGAAPATARRVILAWLAGNLFLGSQLCWVLRPFIGNPATRVEFFSDHPWSGSFYESVFHALQHLFFNPS